MKTKFLKFYSAILSSILVLIGFAGCSDDDEDNGGGWAEYGTPSAKYKVKGSIVSKEDETAIQRIRVVMVETDGDKEAFRGDTVYTDNQGMFNAEFYTFPLEKVTFSIKVDDVDGEANGSFESTTQTVVFDKPTFTGGSSWYRGETEKDLGKITITPSTKTE
ncbi:MAG: radical SAM-associated putative lipoprotein [Dysgonomonas sp.]|nr:radical SAM-associated putative lipoprotein [Dysgonomonas sp.]